MTELLGTYGTLRTRKGEFLHFQDHEGDLGLHTDVYKADMVQDTVVHCTGAAREHCHWRWSLVNVHECYFQRTWGCHKDQNRNMIFRQPTLSLAKRRAENMVRINDYLSMNWTAYLPACMKSCRTQMVSYMLYGLERIHIEIYNLKWKKRPFTCVHAFKQPCFFSCLHGFPQTWVSTRHLVTKHLAVVLQHGWIASYSQVCTRMASSKQGWGEELHTTESCKGTYDMPQPFSLQYAQAWIHRWSVWQLWPLSCERLWTQRRLQVVHWALQSWTPALKSTVAVSKARRSSSTLAWPVWELVVKRDMFDAIHSRTCSMRISTRWLSCTERCEVHSTSGVCWRGWTSAQMFRRFFSAFSRAESWIPVPTK